MSRINDFKNGTLLEARFTNNNHDMIKYVWEDISTDPPVERTDVITFSTEFEIVKIILEKFPVEQLIENYVHFNNEEVRFISKLREFVEHDAKERGIDLQLVPETKAPTDTLESDLLADVLNVNKVNDAEELFKFKLSIFDRPSIKESNDRELKSKIRKATSAIEVLYYFYPVFAEYHENLENVQTEPQDETGLDDNIPQDTSDSSEPQTSETDGSSKNQSTPEEHM